MTTSQNEEIAQVQAAPEKVDLTTNKGVISILLHADKAPKTVANFLHYVQDGFYDGLIFHRVIPGFMIQGGGFDGDFTQKADLEAIENEANNGLKNVRGSLAMARTADPHSASCQFFINLDNNHFLDFTAPTSQGWGYAVFGEVTAGMDVVDAIAQCKTHNRGHHADVPVDNVIIESAKKIA